MGGASTQATQRAATGVIPGTVISAAPALIEIGPTGMLGTSLVMAIL
jgi:hypothetical protein